MGKVIKSFVCIDCGAMQSRWLGRCPDCQGWDTLQEMGAESGPAQRPKTVDATPITEIEITADKRLATGMEELDRVLGGGLIPGSSVLLAGEPGIGKSTVLLQAAQSLAEKQGRFLYITGEESAPQVKLRADRLGISSPELLLLAECDLETIESQILKHKPVVVGIDSIQTLRWQQLPSTAGSILQVREITARLLQLARFQNFPLFLVGHVTKDGQLAGPRLLEHMVDAVLSFEGERAEGLRILRSVKNRFGSTQEVGIFEMSSEGLRQVSNPSELLLSGSRRSLPGAATAALLEGSRPLLVEIQALVSKTSHGSPARKASGFDGARLSMLAAVLEKRLGWVLADQDIYANVVGGVRLTNPSADLALAAAILSSFTDHAIPSDMVFAGEVGLLGEVRQVPGLARRLQEASRLGFRQACVPAAINDSERKHLMDLGMEIVLIEDLQKLQDLF